MKISVVIPAYNEAQRIEQTLRETAAWLKDHHPDHEIIVVNNRSTDETRSIVLDMQSVIPTLKVLDEPTRGKGAAVMAGMRQASGKARLFMDADNSTPVRHLEAMLPYLEQGYDVVIASIAVLGAHILSHEPWHRRVLGRAGNLFIQLLAVPGIHDTQRGFKVFTAHAAQRIFPVLTIHGWGFDVEALALARRFGYRIKEVPVTWNNSLDSHITWHAYPQVLWQTVKVWWKTLTGAYAKEMDHS